MLPAEIGSGQDETAEADRPSETPPRGELLPEVLAQTVGGGEAPEPVVLLDETPGSSPGAGLSPGTIIITGWDAAVAEWVRRLERRIEDE
jgi:hypothetical protein